MTKRNMRNRQGKSAVRPSVIELEAIEVDDKPVENDEMVNPESTDAENVSKEAENTPPTEEAEVIADDAAQDELDVTSDNDSEEQAEEHVEEQLAEPAKKKSRFGMKTTAFLVILGIAGGGGAWAYREYGDWAAQQFGLNFLAPKTSNAAANVNAQLVAAQAKATANGQKLEEMAQALAQLKSSAATTEDSAASAEIPEAITSLPAQVSELKAAVAELKKSIADNNAAITKANEAVNTAANTTGGDTAALEEIRQLVTVNATAISQTKEALEKAAQTDGSTAGAAQTLNLTEIKDEIAKLKQQQEAASTASAAAPSIDPAAFAALGARLQTVEQMIEQKTQDIVKLSQDVAGTKTLAETMSSKAETAAQNAAALRTGMAALNAKIEAGEPFGAELDVLRPIMPFTTELTQLQPLANTGIMSDDALAKMLNPIIEKLTPKAAEQAVPSDKNGDGNWWSGVTSQLSKVVEVRKIDAVNWPETLQTAKASVEAGDLSAAIATVNGQKGEKMAELETWIKQVEQTITARMAVRRLTQMAGN